MKVKLVKVFFDADRVTGRTAGSSSAISKYYHSNRAAYYLFNSKDGFVHMGLSKNGQFHKNDFLAQPKFVSGKILENGAEKVLEIGTGKGANIKYLSTKNPDVSFVGLDLPGGQLNTRKSKFKNLKLVTGDFHDLSKFETDSFDLVFAIESLCHSPDKSKVLSEVYRVLRNNGLFIIFDCYNKMPIQDCPINIRLAMVLIGKSMMVADFGTYKSLKSNIIKTGFSLDEQQDFSQAILPSLDRLAGYAEKYFSNSKKAMLARKIVPSKISTNAIAGYLMPDAVRQGLYEYRLTVARKN